MEALDQLCSASTLSMVFGQAAQTRTNHVPRCVVPWSVTPDEVVTRKGGEGGGVGGRMRGSRGNPCRLQLGSTLSSISCHADTVTCAGCEYACGGALVNDMKESYTGMSHSRVRRVRTHHSQRPHSHPVHPAISLKHRHTPLLSIMTEN
ncbi:hypothetical protein EYF80_006678 [Liparis tanakae]|uniref:Uncharacterized protein n=1 Tax=Liparis tanakae TaxID=230148 RepID=A0A4Z2IZ60_9TELE|nr:hypothetical protein EYF80_006678 [Liparis tanakae]